MVPPSTMFRANAIHQINLPILPKYVDLHNVFRRVAVNHDCARVTAIQLLHTNAWSTKSRSTLSIKQRQGGCCCVLLVFSQLQHSRINNTQTVVLELEDSRTESVFCSQKRLFPVVLNTFLLNYLLYFCFYFDNILNAGLTCNSSFIEFRYQYQVCAALAE